MTPGLAARNSDHEITEAVINQNIILIYEACQDEQFSAMTGYLFKRLERMYHPTDS
jgi:hypothetical protein